MSRESARKLRQRSGRSGAILLHFYGFAFSKWTRNMIHPAIFSPLIIYLMEGIFFCFQVAYFLKMASSI